MGVMSVGQPRLYRSFSVRSKIRAWTCVTVTFSCIYLCSRYVLLFAHPIICWLLGGFPQQTTIAIAMQCFNTRASDTNTAATPHLTNGDDEYHDLHDDEEGRTAVAVFQCGWALYMYRQCCMARVACWHEMQLQCRLIMERAATCLHGRSPCFTCSHPPVS